MTTYQTPAVEELGDVEALTQGGKHSRVDGNSNTVGNAGEGKGGVTKPT